MIVSLLALALSPGAGGEIAERMAQPASFTLTSDRSPQDLEFCIADALSIMGAPSAFRDGADRVVLTSWDFSKAMGVVDLRHTGTSTSVTGYFRYKSWDDRVKARVVICLR